MGSLTGTLPSMGDSERALPAPAGRDEGYAPMSARQAGLLVMREQPRGWQRPDGPGMAAPGGEAGVSVPSPHPLCFPPFLSSWGPGKVALTMVGAGQVLPQPQEPAVSMGQRGTRLL